MQPQPCFVQNIELTNLHCPFCKRRIGTWCRQAGKDLSKLIDVELWGHIRERFPDLVEARLSGRTDEDATKEGIFYVEFSHDICAEGQIGKEFEHQLEQLRQEERARQAKETLKSQALIAKIQLEELRSGRDEVNASLDVSDVLATPKVPDRVHPAPGTPDVIDETFLDLQKQAEKRILQAKADEELARRLQELEESAGSQVGTNAVASKAPSVVTRRGAGSAAAASPKFSSPSTNLKKRPLGPRQMTIEESMRFPKRHRRL